MGQNIESKYEYILSNIQKRLEKEGYKRSGKSGVFYRYHADKQIACVFGLQKSTLNSSEMLNFTFNLGCITLDEILDADPNFWDSALTLAVLKQALRSVFLTERIGNICRGYDAWYDISEYGLMERCVAQYYTDIIEPDIEKSILHLNELLKNKLNK